MLFDYKAVSREGRMVSGRLDAINAVDLETRLKKMELDLISGKPLAYRRRLFVHKTPRRELINFCLHLDQLTRSGVAILDGLADLRDSIDNPRFREVIASMIERIEGGQTLSQALACHPDVFNAVFVNLIGAGESSGQLPEVLHSLSESLKWEDELASQTQKLLMYPAVVGGIVLSATFFLMAYMVPQLKMFVKNMGQALPLHTQLLFFISDLLRGYWYVFLILPVIAVIALRLLLRSNPLARRRFDAMKLGVPVVGPILKKIILSRFANTFAMLYAAGIPVIEAIRKTQDVVGNQVVHQALLRVEQAIRDGQNIAGAFHDVGLFPPLVVRMLRVGETTGGLDKALLNVSYFYNRDIKESVAKAQALIEPMLTVCMGALLGWIMLSVIGPIYDVVSTLKV
jgi:type IV pilus assembly protein PilC